MTLRAQYWLRMLYWSIAAATTATSLTYAVNEISWRSPLGQLLVPFGVALVFTGTIVPLAASVMPRVIGPLRRRLPFPLHWIAMFAVMILLGLIGSTVAIGLLWSIGYIPTSRVWGWFGGSVRTSIIMTLVFGMSISAIESMRARLDNAEMALRTKERDEAEARRLAAEAQLASLESRVNPHFLFNTLNSIATLVHDNPAAAERMTTQLAALLRSSLHDAGPVVPLQDELALVRAYLDIERVRFGDRLHASVDASAIGADARVPRLAVQTLVENSVKYAVSPRREGGTVNVRAAASNGRVTVEVADDGPGFDASAAPEGHGLALLRSRLAMAFGDRATLRIESVPGRTSARIEIDSEPSAHPSTGSG